MISQKPSASQPPRGMCRVTKASGQGVRTSRSRALYTRPADNHKAIWLCELKIVQEALESAGAQGSGAFGQNVGKKHGGKGGETRRGQKRSGPWTYNHQNYQDIRETQAAGLAQPYYEARETEAAGYGLGG